jgi:DNA-binding GntR family transcriptional regulator
MMTPIAFAPSLREQIVDRLRANLLSGHIPEGESLTEQELSERFAASRTPIREALQQLTYEGLLEGRRFAGVRVTRQPATAIVEFAVTIRRSVETFAVRSYFHEFGEPEFRQWGEILDRMRAGCVARDYRAIAEHDIAFHRALVRRAYARELEGVWISLLSGVRRHFLDTHRTNYPDPLAIHAEHVAMVDVFRAGDLEAALQTLENHIC